MSYITNIFVVYFLIIIPILLIISARKWFFITRELNKKLNQSFSPFLYSIFWIIPFINLFIVWIILGDAWDKGVIDKNKSLLKHRLSVLVPYLLICGSYGIIFIPLTLMAVILMVIFPITGEILLQATPFIAVAISLIYFLKLLKNLKNIEKEILK